MSEESTGDDGASGDPVAELGGDEAGTDPVAELGGDASGSFRRRTLERLCARRAALTVGFVLSGMIFVVSVFLVLFADLPRGSTVIATVDAAITGTLCLATGAVLRLCRRVRRGEGP